MVYNAAWKSAKKWGMPFDEVQAQGYLVFMEALKRYQKDKNVKFGTFLFSRLRTLDDYCMRERCFHGRAVQKLIDNYKKNPQEFYTHVSSILENTSQLSPDAKEILRFILECSWEKLGSNIKPSKHMLKRVFYKRGWKCQRIWDAWDELKIWYSHQIA